MTLSELKTKSPRIGTAGWNIGREVRERFIAEGSLLARYSRRLSAVEINSSFYRAHLPATYHRWAAETPDDFRFSVKLPRRITHELQLLDASHVLTEFLTGVVQLGGKFGVLLIQLPPSLEFDAATAEAFLAGLRQTTLVTTACEPRHASWFSPEAEAMFVKYEIARVAADPAPVPAAADPGGWRGLNYFRLHGSPRMYYSAYDDAYLANLRERLAREAAGAETWCIFDNTAEGCATRNALAITDG